VNLRFGAALEPIKHEDGAELPMGVSKANNSDDLAVLVDWIIGVAGTNPENRLTIVSTNYDLCLETALYEKIGGRTLGARKTKVFESVDFGVPFRDPASGDIVYRPQRPNISLFKLHGSLNWLRCDACDHMYVQVAGPLSTLADDDPPKPSNSCHCSHKPLSRIIVASSNVRDIRDSSLLSVWRSALEAMRTAGEWVIVGYSMPPEDLAIRSLLRRAYAGRKDPPVIRVFQRSTESEPRYRLDFPKCDFLTSGFAGFIQQLKQANPAPAPAGPAVAGGGAHQTP
jgi:hypothetical protein